MGLLSLAIWTPIFFGVVLLAFGNDQHAKVVRWIALVGSLVSLAVTVPLYSRFELGTSAMQFVEKASWIERFNVFYHLGLDGVSLWFVLLTAFITASKESFVFFTDLIKIIKINDNDIIFGEDEFFLEYFDKTINKKRK